MGKILKIREVGDPVLNLVCKKVDIQNINNEIFTVNVILVDKIGNIIKAAKEGIHGKSNKIFT